MRFVSINFSKHGRIVKKYFVYERIYFPILATWTPFVFVRRRYPTRQMARLAKRHPWKMRWMRPKRFVAGRKD